MFWKECKALQDELVAMRRELHQIPELGKDLPKTRAYVTAKLDAMGIPYELSETDSGILAFINKGKPGKVVSLRADMDALPIHEETGVPYASKHDGCMHACGHDTHTTMLLGAAKILNAHKEELNGEVRLMFQTAEEQSKGAPLMVANGGVKGADAVFGTHIGTILSKDIPTGTIICCPGPVMASFDRFIIKVKGVGCHGSTPEKGIDPVNIAAHIVIGLEAINAREFNACVPVVITIGIIRGGAAYNAIPSEVLIEGTTRALDEEVRQKLARRIGEIAQCTAQAYAKEVVGEDHVITSVEHPNMGGEDFAYFLAEVPGAFMFLSSSNPAKGTDVAHHNPKFNVDEDVFWMGAATFVNIAEKFLNG